jgi:hypothetical protein
MGAMAASTAIRRNPTAAPHIVSAALYALFTMRENKIVWGVGRGSSVASYVLFLIGVHKINSIKYNLDINEFLK